MSGAAGLSVALAGGASAATGAPAATMLMPNHGASHESTLLEEAIFDVTLATFLVVNKEAAATFQATRKLAMGPWAVDAAAGALAVPVGQAPTERRQNAMLVCNNVRANPHIPLSTRFQRGHRKRHRPIRRDCRRGLD